MLGGAALPPEPVHCRTAVPGESRGLSSPRAPLGGADGGCRRPGHSPLPSCIFQQLIRPPDSIRHQMTTSIMRFIAGNGAARLLPSRLTHSLPWDHGDMHLVDLDTMVSSLQAKVISRLLEPERLPWKIYFRMHLGRDRMAYGPRSVFTTRRVSDMGIQNRRAAGYVRAFRSLHPHRLAEPAAMTTLEILREPLIYNAQVREGGQPLPASGIWLPVIRAGITVVRHLTAPPPAIVSATIVRLVAAPLPRV